MLIICSFLYKLLLKTVK